MKDRIKKFYHDHEDSTWAAAIAVPVIVLSAVAANQFYQNSTGANIKTVYVYDDDNGIQHVNVEMKNNASRTFHKKPITEEK